MIIGNIEYFTEYDLYGLCAEFDQEDYRSMPAQTSRGVINQVFNNFKTWKSAKKEFYKNPTKFKTIPKIPKYKKGNKQNLVIFTKQQVKVVNGIIKFPKRVNLPPIKTKVSQSQFVQVRIVPKATCYVIEVIYEKETTDLNLDKNNFLSIDLGLNNYISAISNVDKPFIINGKIIKSFNQWYNKKLTKLQSNSLKTISKRIKKLHHYRNCWITDKNHKISRYIINYCITNNIGTIVIGKNIGWKDNINMGKKSNQKFVQIPHSKLTEQILYKGEMVGIKVLLTEESYTSKVDNLAMENLGKNINYSGKRIKRGLFQSSVGKIINADINGAIGIARKVLDNSHINEIINSGVVLTPIKINIL